MFVFFPADSLCFRIENNTNIAGDIASIFSKLWPKVSDDIARNRYGQETDTYDLNQLVCQQSVMAAVHFYENTYGFHPRARYVCSIYTCNWIKFTPCRLVDRTARECVVL